MHSQKFLEYNALDAACTLEIQQAIWDTLEKEQYWQTYNLTTRLFPVLMFMQTRGIKVDQERLQKTRTFILKTQEEKQNQLNALCGRPLNVNSPKDCQNFFYIERNIPPYKNKGGNISVDDMALQRIARGTATRPGMYEAKLVQEIRGLAKLYSTYLTIEFDQDERLRASFNPRGTKFGRLSSSKTIFGTGANLQNLPQAFKQFLVPDPGYIFLDVDKRQAEWVVVAYLSGDANMIAAIEQGADVHVHTASLMFNLDESIIKWDNELIGHMSDADKIKLLRSEDTILKHFDGLPRTMSARQCGKKSNHGLNYGEGFKTFSLINEILEIEGKRIVNAYHKVYPGIHLWHDNVKRQLQKDRTLVNCMGRRIHFMDAWGDSLWKAAYSAIPQSTVVDSLNRGMVFIYADPTLTGIAGYNLDILAQVHDSILMQVPLTSIDTEEKFNHLIQTVTLYTSPELNYSGRTFTIASDFKMGLNWGEVGTDNADGMKDIKSYADFQRLLENINEGTQ